MSLLVVLVVEMLLLLRQPVMVKAAVEAAAYKAGVVAAIRSLAGRGQHRAVTRVERSLAALKERNEKNMSLTMIFKELVIGAICVCLPCLSD